MIKHSPLKSKGGPVVKNSLSNAEDTVLIPGRGTKIPHATEELNWRAATRELSSSEPAHSRAHGLQQVKLAHHN